MKKLLIFLVCSVLSATGVGQVYKQVDKNGNVTFTDQASPGSERIEVEPTNTASPPPVNAYPLPPPVEQAPPAVDYQVAISAPADETIIPRGPGNFSVSASVSPAVASDHKLQLLLDGEPRQEPQSATSWSLTNVFRGEHSLEVAVVDAKGKVISKSDPVRVYVFRPSVNDANRGSGPRPPRPTPRS